MIDSMTSARERISKLDVAIAVVATLVGLAMMITEVSDETIDAPALAVPFFALMTVPLLWRRVAPIGALVATFAGLLVHVALFGDVIRCGVMFPVVFLLVFAAGARLETRQALLGLALGMGIDVAVCLSDHATGADISAMSFVGPLAVAVWGAGRVVRSRSRMVVELEARTNELRETRDERARLEVSTDRARLSAELDELLQRRLGELARLADRGAQDGDPGAATATLEAIEHESRRTLDQMRAVVGVLRNDQSDVPMAPQPTLTHMEGLLVRAKGAGARLKVEGNPRALPAGVELSAYRVLEHLLDALQDADDVEVCVRFGDDALELRVSGPARRRGEEAIERARERVRLHRGTLEATTHGGRAEAVVSLPVFAAV